MWGAPLSDNKSIPLQTQYSRAFFFLFFLHGQSGTPVTV